MRQKISVCIATYNGEKYIKEQLLSILPQLGTDDEVIISDDNSQDKTLDIIKDFKDHRINIFINEGRKGYTPNFENALKHANGDIIFLSDQDDIWVPNKVQSCLCHLRNADFVVSDATLIDSKGNYISESFYSLRKPFHSLVGNVLKFGYLGCCMAFNRRVLNKALPFPIRHNLCTHDNWLFLVAKTYYNVIITDEKLIQYRRHNNNTSTGGVQNTTNIRFKIFYRIYLIYQLFLLINKKVH